MLIYVIAVVLSSGKKYFLIYNTHMCFWYRVNTCI